MKTNLKWKAMILFMASSFATQVVAQEEEEALNPITISGSVDTYYRTNLNSSNNLSDGATHAPPTSFANLPGFSLGMANLVLSQDGEKAGFVGDFVFGPRGEEAVSNS